MRIEIPKVIRPLYLRDYAAEYGEAVVWVWVNPTSGMVEEHDGLVTEAEELRQRAFGEDERRSPQQPEAPQPEEAIRRLTEIGEHVVAWTAKIWSQGPEGTQWTPEEISEVIKKSAADDPQLWPWMRRNTMRMIAEYRTGQKKA